LIYEYLIGEGFSNKVTSKFGYLNGVDVTSKLMV